MFPRPTAVRLAAAAFAVGGLLLLAACTYDPVLWVFAICGDGVVQSAHEVCDDAGANADAWSLQPHCDASCSALAPHCGDGVVDAPQEVCDLGAQNSDAYGVVGGCRTDCSGPPPRCGDGSLDADFEVCDAGAAATDSYGVTTGCRTDCSGAPPHCGDATVQSSNEVCEVEADCADDWRCKLCDCEPAWCQGPLNPNLRTGLSLGSGSFGIAAAIEGDRLYVAAGAVGVQVFDIAIRESLIPITTIATAGFANDVDVEAGLVYVSSSSTGVEVFDPDGGPGPLGTAPAASLNGLEVDGDVVYVTTKPNMGATWGFWTVDVTDPTAPVILDVLGLPNFTEVTVRLPYAYVTENNGVSMTASTGLSIVDVSDPSALARVGQVLTPGDARGAAVRGDYAYVADGVNEGLTVVDISDPSAPAVVGQVRASVGNDVALFGNYAVLAAGGPDGLVTIDISTPTAPVLGASLPMSSASGLALRDNYAYVVGKPGADGYLSVVRLCVLP